MQYRVLRQRNLAVVAALAVVASTVTATLAETTATAAPAMAQHAMPLRSSERVIAPLAPNTLVSAKILLAPSDRSAVSSFIAQVSDRSSPQFHHFLTTGEFGQRFGPSDASIRSVEDFFRAQGFSTATDATHPFEMSVRGKAATVNATFNTVLRRVRNLQTKHLYQSVSLSPRIPVELAHTVVGVLGLSDLPIAHSLAHQIHHTTALPLASTIHKPHATTAVACQDAIAESDANGGYTADFLGYYYGMGPLYGLNDVGSGVRIAIPEIDALDMSDVDTFQACFGTHATVNEFSVDGGTDSAVSSGEAALDVEANIGIAPGATIDVEYAPASPQGTYDSISDIVNTNMDNAIAISWGICENDSDQSIVSGMGVLFDQAAAQGQSVFVASGDDGSADCSDSSSLEVSEPASQQNVIAVGGTTITPDSEVVWNDGTSGTGGGTSADWCMPSYQFKPQIPGLIAYDSWTASSCNSGYARQVPDVSAVGDPATGMVIYANGKWTTFGGTSLSAPIWSGISAIVSASPYCSTWGSNVGGDAGVLPKALYAMATRSNIRQQMFYDVTSGNNDVGNYHSGVYQSRTGFDMASGFGTPQVTGLDGGYHYNLSVPGLAAAMCWYWGTKNLNVSITSITPSTFSAQTATAVTIRGTGFIPIQSGDILTINGSVNVTAQCASTTVCSATIPPLSAGTFATTMGVERLASSTNTAASTIHVVARKAQTSTSFTATPVAVPYGTSSTLIATVTPRQATGTVTFSRAGSVWCVANLVGGVARCSSPASLHALPNARYSVAATYSGNSTYAGSSGAVAFSVVRTHPLLTAKALPAVALARTPVVLRVSGFPGVATGVITFRAGTRVLCQATLVSGAAQCTAPPTLGRGTYQLSAGFAGTADVFPSTATFTLKLT